VFPYLFSDALGEKPVLEVTLLDRWDQVAACGVEKAPLKALQRLARQGFLEAESWRQTGNQQLKSGDEPDILKQREAMARIAVEEKAGLEKYAGNKLPCVLEVLEAGWDYDRNRGPVFTTVSVTYNVFATQYAANTSDEVAVPDYCIKFANLGWGQCSSGYGAAPYYVLLNNGGNTYQAWVGDVGPWNIDDNYWNSSGDSSRPRRLFGDLPQGYNESRAAYYDNYNGGYDQYGRTVGNPAGIDLAPDTASRIGLAYL
jgi:hypothetical protein